MEKHHLSLGIPQTIIAYNGPQFDSIAFRNFCSELNIRNSYSTPVIRKVNGQAEATNKTQITALKKRLEQAKGKWVEELPGVLWAYRTTPECPTGNTPFALVYGMDAIIPTEIGLPTIRTEAGKQDDANTKLGRNLDWADKVREAASIRMPDYQQRASAHYNRKAKPRSFKNGLRTTRYRNKIAVKYYKKGKLSLSLLAALLFLLAWGYLRPELPHLALRRAFSSSASADGHPKFPPGSLPQQALPGEPHYPLERWINWLRPPPVSNAAYLHYLCAERRRPSCNQQSAAGQKIDHVVRPCREEQSYKPRTNISEWQEK
ncbi:hypothetical protein CK203_096233 [Vitis vinifera]|uniref:Integrase catalytic domain-containing protein n=1 Tax=Vitis vinifera TaxID=29760 RepID=A0A438EEZ4_VITVI|nr:hypothetical protein CK203_096233 [Vitis vinifera]